MDISIIPKTLGMAVFTLTVIAGFDVALTESGRQAVVSALNLQEETVVRPEVLVVASNRSDQLSVVTTVETRGYDVLLATNYNSGIQALDGAGKQKIRILVIDMAVPNSGVVLHRIQSNFPKVRIIKVDRNHSAVYLARQLLNAIV